MKPAPLEHITALCLQVGPYAKPTIRPFQYTSRGAGPPPPHQLPNLVAKSRRVITLHSKPNSKPIRLSAMFRHADWPEADSHHRLFACCVIRAWLDEMLAVFPYSGSALGGGPISQNSPTPPFDHTSPPSLSLSASVKPLQGLLLENVHSSPSTP